MSAPISAISAQMGIREAFHPQIDANSPLDDGPGMREVNLHHSAMRILWKINCINSWRGHIPGLGPPARAQGANPGTESNET
jgi:hypothetical protein